MPPALEGPSGSGPWKAGAGLWEPLTAGPSWGEGPVWEQVQISGRVGPEGK